jgi:hypothetical protein
MVPMLVTGFGLAAACCLQSEEASQTTKSAEMALFSPAGTPGSPGIGPPSAAARVLSQEAVGDVVTADPATQVLVIDEEDAGRMTFAVPDSAVAILATLKPADPVFVRYTPGDAEPYRAEAIHKAIIIHVTTSQVPPAR